MGGSSSKKKKEEEEKEKEKLNKKNDNQEKEKEKEKEDENNIKKVGSSKNNYIPPKDICLDGPIRTYESKISESIIDKKPIYPIFKEKDYNLEITNYFNQNIFISEEKNVKDNIYYRYKQILYNIESKGLSTNKNKYLDEINEKINSDFCLKN